jgi:hypothetical protein
MNPLGRIGLEETKGGCDGQLLVQRTQEMNMIWHATSRLEDGFLRAQNAAEVGVEPGLQVGGDCE